MLKPLEIHHNEFKNIYTNIFVTFIAQGLSPRAR